MNQTFKSPFHRIKFYNTSAKEIEKHSLFPTNKYSYVCDEISAILNISAFCICSLLRYICDKAISTRKFTSHLKYSIVKLIFNKGDKENFANCRPVSIVTSFSKVLEKIIDSRLLKYINNSNILVNERFGFRSDSSMELASYNIQNFKSFR